MAADDLTHYHVYEVTDIGGDPMEALHLVGEAKAHDGRRAVAAVVEKAGTYVAIPARSLKTHTVKTETQLRITVT